MLKLKTQYLEVFEEVLKAIRAIEKFKMTRERALLDNAFEQLDRARDRDQDYLLSPYYMAMIEDLLGHSNESSERLSQLLMDMPQNDLRLVLEMRLNLATARYHMYRSNDLVVLGQELDQLLADLREFYGRRYRRIRHQARALQAQIYATRMVTAVSPTAYTQEALAEIRVFHRKAQEAARGLAFGRWSSLRSGRYFSDSATGVAAIARNALAQAEMYLTDYAFDVPAKLDRLSWALDQLGRDRVRFNGDPANQYDRASCLMRLGIWGNSQEELDDATNLLTTAIDQGWPGYGFALFEIGRIFRVTARMADAIDSFHRARDIPRDRRGVSTRRVERELDRAMVADATYP